MSGGPNSFGSAKRGTVAQGNDPNPGADLVTVFGQDFESNPLTPSGYAVGVFAGNGVNLVNSNVKLLGAAAVNYSVDVLDGFLWTNLSGGSDSDSVDPQTQGVPFVNALAGLFNGSGAAPKWKRARGAYFDNVHSMSGDGAALVAAPGQWSAFHVPAAATKATIDKSTSGAPGAALVVQTISAQLVIPPAANQPAITLNLIYEPAGAATVMYSWRFGVGAAVAAGLVQQVSLTGLNIIMPGGSDIRLEFSAAGAAGTLENVAMTGYEAR